jgi:DNA-binding PadR family transcriptional regulator
LIIKLDAMSTTRMMILGLVSWMQPVHGYDVRRELLSWRADEWANIHPGSIYHALKRLTSEGLLREVATERVGARPARTTYEITAKGTDEFETLLRKHWWECESPVDPFQAALAFMPALPAPEVSAALRNRANVLRGSAEFFRAAIESGWAADRKPPHVTWQFERSIALAETEAQWCDRIAAFVEDGVPYQPDNAAGRPMPGTPERVIINFDAQPRRG